MRSLILALMLLAMLISVNSQAGEIYAKIEKKGANTIVSCTPQNIEGDIVGAIITLYKPDGDTITVTREEMDILANMATYILPNSFLKVDGKCKFFFSRKNVFSANSGDTQIDGFTVAKADFYASRK